MSGYFPEPKSLGGRESNLENATGVDTSKFAKKVDLAYLNPMKIN